jgi:hypothetical protein
MLQTSLNALAPLALLAGCATSSGQGPVATPVADVPRYSAAEVHTISADEVRQGYIKHATLAQYHRWYQVYENDDSTLDNAVDILDANVRVKSGLGEARGTAAYRERVSKLPSAWDNAHDVRDTVITINPDGTIRLVANVTYLNRGMLPEGAVRVGDLTYRTTLRPSESVLPKFTDIEIIQNSESKGAELVPAYGANRIKSLVHYWLALIEDPRRDVEPLRELLADGFVLNFSSGRLDTFDELKSWYTGPASSITTSTHTINSLTQKEIAPGSYAVEADFGWQGIRPDGKVMVGRTLHKWTVVDDPAERFARIKTADVTLLIPFQPKP